MLLNCSSLVELTDERGPFIVNASNIPVNVTNDDQYWFSEDDTSIFDYTFGRNEFYVVLLILIALLIVLSYLSIKYNIMFSEKYQRMKLQSLGVSLKSDIVTLLNPYFNYNTDIMEIICEYLQTLNEDDIIKMDQKTSLKSKLLSFILINTLFIFSYIPIYFVIIHLLDSYNSYVEISCIAYSTKTEWSPPGQGCKKGCWEDVNYVSLLDLNHFCMDNTYDGNATFIGYLKGQSYVDNTACFINKNTYKLRAASCCQEYCYSCSRCGQCYCFGVNCCQMVAIYLWSTLFSLFCCIFACCLYRGWCTMSVDSIKNYKIKHYSVTNEDDEEEILLCTQSGTSHLSIDG